MKPEIMVANINLIINGLEKGTSKSKILAEVMNHAIKTTPEEEQGIALGTLRRIREGKDAQGILLEWASLLSRKLQDPTFRGKYTTIVWKAEDVVNMLK
jgi:hypothetical protein